MLDTRSAAFAGNVSIRTPVKGVMHWTNRRDHMEQVSIRTPVKGVIILIFCPT